MPWSGKVIYLNSFVPGSVHYVGTIFAVVLFAVISIGKAVAEYWGTVEVQFVGLAAVTDLRNEVYEKVVRQPIGFFQQHSTGRLMSSVINDVERVRSVLSDSLSSFFRYVFTFVFLMAVLGFINWRLALGSMVLVPVILWPARSLGRPIRRAVEFSQARLSDIGQILQETLSGNRVVKAFGMERFEVARFRAQAQRSPSTRKYALDSLVGTHTHVDGCSGCRRYWCFLVLRASRDQAWDHDDRNFPVVCVCAGQGVRTDQRVSGASISSSSRRTAPRCRYSRLLSLQEEIQEQAGAKESWLHFRAKSSSTTSVSRMTPARQSCVGSAFGLVRVR